MKQFDKDKYDRTMNDILSILDDRRFTPLELAYISINFMLTCGSSLMDGKDDSFRTVYEEMKTSPSIGGALCLQAHATHEFLRKFSRDESDTEWETFLPSRIKKLAGKDIGGLDGITEKRDSIVLQKEAGRDSIELDSTEVGQENDST